jgi:hypothetical protein
VKALKRTKMHFVVMPGIYYTQLVYWAKSISYINIADFLTLTIIKGTPYDSLKY